MDSYTNEQAVLLLAGKFEAVPSGDFYRKKGAARIYCLAVKGLVAKNVPLGLHVNQAVEHSSEVFAHSSRAAKSSIGRAIELIETRQVGVIKQQLH